MVRRKRDARRRGVVTTLLGVAAAGACVAAVIRIADWLAVEARIRERLRVPADSPSKPADATRSASDVKVAAQPTVDHALSGHPPRKRRPVPEPLLEAGEEALLLEAGEPERLLTADLEELALPPGEQDHHPAGERGGQVKSVAGRPKRGAEQGGSLHATAKNRVPTQAAKDGPSQTGAISASAKVPPVSTGSAQPAVTRETVGETEALREHDFPLPEAAMQPPTEPLIDRQDAMNSEAVDLGGPAGTAPGDTSTNGPAPQIMDEDEATPNLTEGG